MDIYDYLEKDHQKVADLFKQLEKTESDDIRVATMELIIRELIVHAKSEEETFYKTLKKFDESRDEAEHGKKEHEEMEKLMAKISKAIAGKKAWYKTAEELKETVEHHVKEEEGTLFREAKKVLNRDEEFALKEQMHYLKGLLLTKYDE